MTSDTSEAGADAWDLPDPFAIDVVVAPGDIDGYGHANNACYVRWCEEVVWAHSRSVGMDLADFQELGRAMAVHHSEFDYLAPAFEGDRLEVANWIVAIDGRLSARRQFQIRRPADGRTLLRAEIRFVCIDLASGRPRRMPARFLETYPVLPSVRAALLAVGRDPDRAR